MKPAVPVLCDSCPVYQNLG